LLPHVAGPPLSSLGPSPELELEVAGAPELELPAVIVVAEALPVSDPAGPVVSGIPVPLTVIPPVAGPPVEPSPLPSSLHPVSKSAVQHTARIVVS
jgi:hypothetical protein